MSVLVGGNGDDQVFGDDGDDQLIGGSGSDKLAGGNGKAVLVYRAASDSTSASYGVISDLVLDKDTIDLRDILGAETWNASVVGTETVLHDFNASNTEIMQIHLMGSNLDLAGTILT